MFIIFLLILKIFIVRRYCVLLLDIFCIWDEMNLYFKMCVFGWIVWVICFYRWLLWNIRMLKFYYLGEKLKWKVIKYIYLIYIYIMFVKGNIKKVLWDIF